MVYLNAEKVGGLSLDAKRRFVFQYGGAWFERTDSVPLSLVRPLQP